MYIDERSRKIIIVCLALIIILSAIMACAFLVELIQEGQKTTWIQQAVSSSSFACLLWAQLPLRLS